MRSPPLVLSVMILLLTATLPAVSHQVLAAPSEVPQDDSTNDVLLVLDTSGSMKGLSVRDLRRVIEEARDGTHLGVMSFSGDAELALPLGPVSSEGERTAAVAALESLRFDGLYTDVVAALRGALECLLQDAAESHRFIILLSDGRIYPPPGRGTAADLLAELRGTVLPDLKKHGVVVHAVAYGDANIPLMREIAAFTDGVCLVSPGPETLNDAFSLLMDHLQVPPLPGGEPGPGPSSWVVLLFVAMAAAGVVSLIVVSVVFLLARRAAGPPPRRPSTAGARHPGGADAGLMGLSESVSEVRGRVAGAASDLETVRLDLEDFAVKSWERAKESESGFQRVLAGIFLMLDHGPRPDGVPDEQTSAGRLRVKALRILEDEGIEEIPVAPGHDRFNGAVHNQVGARPDELPVGVVLEVARVGYWRRSQDGGDPTILRPAEVIVSSRKILDVGG